MSQGRYSTMNGPRVPSRALCDSKAALPAGQVAEVFGADRTTLFRWLKWYRREGEDSGLHRQTGSGRPRKLKELPGARLLRLILQPASSFGFETDLWTVGRVHQLVQEKMNVSISKNTIWRRLREAGLTYQKQEC